MNSIDTKGTNGKRSEVMEGVSMEVIDQSALMKLREGKTKLENSGKLKQIEEDRRAVLAKYGPAFSYENLPKLDGEVFRSFLYIENNKHWTGLNRKGWRALENMPKLRKSLQLFLDEARPLSKRVDATILNIPGMGKALASAILLVTYPDRYGVWNNTSEEALKRLDLWPTFERGKGSIGQKYERINSLLLSLAKELSVDLWTLDIIWWEILRKEGIAEISDSIGQAGELDLIPDEVSRFSLEKHLQDFLYENWEKTDLGREWNLYQEEGDEDAAYEYPTGVGKIDILAKHKREPRWLVIELKRNQTSDATVGQVCRYIGWVKENLANKHEKVEGLIIAHKAEEQIKYALKVVPDVDLSLYEVNFKLRKPGKAKK